jgi:hypothetical protein
VLIYIYSNLNTHARSILSLCISRDAIDLESISTLYSIIQTRRPSTTHPPSSSHTPPSPNSAARP